ncbi:hypothetical protein AMA2_49 [Achromobacter phage AMA2]|nr:hypothetical protein AMA2_49 [Achromobacter phage AMA2]
MLLEKGQYYNAVWPVRVVTRVTLEVTFELKFQAIMNSSTGEHHDRRNQEYARGYGQPGRYCSRGSFPGFVPRSEDRRKPSHCDKRRWHRV